MIKITSVEKEDNKIKVIIGRGNHNEIKYFDTKKYFKNWLKFNKLKWN